MGIYLDQAQTAAALIAEAGGPVTLERPTSGLRDPVHQTRTGGPGGASEPYGFLAICLPPSMAQRLGVNLEGRRATEVYFALDGGPVDAAGEAVIPQPGDILVQAPVGTPGPRLALFWTQTFDPAGDGPIFTIGYAEAK